MDVDDYLQEVNRQLDNKEFYKKLTIDTTEINCIKVSRIISKLKSLYLLNEKIANVLLRSEAKTQKHKMLPKVHKESNPGAPVVSLIDCYTTKTSKYIDHQYSHMKKNSSRMSKTLQISYGKWTAWKKIPDSCILATMNVRFLYAIYQTRKELKLWKQHWKQICNYKNHLDISPLGISIN